VRLPALITVAAAFLAISATTGATSSRPQLRLTDRTPLVISGRHFRPLEQVRVVVLIRDGVARRVVASRAGVFTARFDDVTVTRCEPLSVRATGGRGSDALLKLPAPACLPVKTP